MPTACEPWPGKRNAMVIVTGASRPAWTEGGLREKRVAPTRPLPPDRLFSPADEGGSPREAPAERDDEHEVAALQTARCDGLLECHVDGRGARVAVPVDVHEHALHRQGDALGGRLDDAEVRLMRNEQVHVGRGGPVAAQSALGGLDD